MAFNTSSTLANLNSISKSLNNINGPDTNQASIAYLKSQTTILTNKMNTLQTLEANTNALMNNVKGLADNITNKNTTIINIDSALKNFETLLEDAQENLDTYQISYDSANNNFALIDLTTLQDFTGVAKAFESVFHA